MNTQNELSPVQEILNSLKGWIATKRKEIQDFFSSERGKGERIRKVYRDVHDNVDVLAIRLPVRDVNFAIVTYLDDYYKGMLKFTNEILSIANTGESTAQNTEITNNLEKARENDSQFIDSLFSDIRNPVNGDEPIKNAFNSLESLVDFLDKLNELNDDITHLHEKSDQVDYEPAINAVKLYSSSLQSFIEKTIYCIFDIFNDIENAVYGTGGNRGVTESVEDFLLFD